MRAQSILCDPTWAKFECDHGARWTEVVEYGLTSHEGDTCCFSGCAADHSIHCRGTTEDTGEAHAWFRRPQITAEETKP
jgi:hypothetical protein